MPFETTLFQLPCGARAVRMETTGTLSAEDAQEIVLRVQMGGELHDLPALIMAKELSSISSEARGVFTRRDDVRNRQTWTAVVMNNPLIRVTANFIMRIQRSRRTRLFSGEPEALQWLDGQIRTDLVKKGAS